MTAVAGNGYPIDTSSNECTITLPASASVGDTLIFSDYARNWATNKIIIDSNGLNYQGEDDTWTVEYSTDGLSLAITYMDATNGWIPTTDDDVTDAPTKGNLYGIFAYGEGSGKVAISNLVSSTGVVASDTSGVGTARYIVAGASYGGDKGIFAFGLDASAITGVSNLVSNSGVVASDVTAVGSARYGPSACEYGTDTAIFAYGWTTTYVSMSNLVSDAGVIASDVTGVGTDKKGLAGCSYGGDKGIFCYGEGTGGSGGGTLNARNLVSNLGVIAADVSGAGTIRADLAACEYGYDKGIFGFGNPAGTGYVGVTNLVTNVGVVGTDVTAVGTARRSLSACDYGYDKGIFAYGTTGSLTAVSNLVSNAGVIAADVSGVGTVRIAAGACEYG
jgi:hypothetical protein